MLVRFVLNNLFSFGSETEFNLIPKPRLRTLDHHKYNINKGLEVLKLSAIYGANGSGKSNLIKGISLLRRLIIFDKIPRASERPIFKFQPEGTMLPQMLAVEFVNNDSAYYYAVELEEDLIKSEELYLSGLGQKKDELIYERKTTKNKKISVKFFKEFEEDQEAQVLKKVIIKNLAKPNKPILKLLTTLDNSLLKVIDDAINWFDEKLVIITPEMRPNALPHLLDTDSKVGNFAEDAMCSFNIGIKSLKTNTVDFDTFFRNVKEEELQSLMDQLEEAESKILGLTTPNGEVLTVIKEEDQVIVKQLLIEHEGRDGITAQFDLDEESDGTVRLLDLLPAFSDIIGTSRVFFIDEIERSIHPLLIKELIAKLSADESSLGQLIFTTHESVLLDQDIFRQDEIWFMEKDSSGSSDLYSLSDFKEHNTLDIRKGYLNGRYGSIPFVANLHDLNWHKRDTKK